MIIALPHLAKVGESRAGREVPRALRTAGASICDIKYYNKTLLSASDQSEQSISALHAQLQCAAFQVTCKAQACREQELIVQIGLLALTYR